MYVPKYMSWSLQRRKKSNYSTNESSFLTLYVRFININIVRFRQSQFSSDHSFK